MTFDIEDATRMRDAVDWDELDDVAVVGIDSEGVRRVYTSTANPMMQLWLARHLGLHADEQMSAAQRDLGPEGQV